MHAFNLTHTHISTHVYTHTLATGLRLWQPRWWRPAKMAFWWLFAATQRSSWCIRGRPVRASRGWARRGGGNGKEWGEGGGVSFVAIVSVNMGKGVAKLGSNPRKKIIISLIIWLRQNQEKFYFGEASLSSELWIFKLASHVCGSESAPLADWQWAWVNTFSLSEFPHAICRPNTQSMTPRYKRMKLNVWQGPGQKQHFTK